MADSLGYRRDLDGLRGLSILLVVLYHARLPLSSSGFVGVDVFFVLSGYLITRICAAELADGQLSLTRFYLRRARRILPALFVVLTVTLAAGWIFLFPNEYRALAKHTVAALSFSANLTHYAESGYFSPSNDLKPLLMTWSLSIEEQFYLLWPLILTWILRAKRPLIWVIGGIFGSLLVQALLAERNEAAAFFLMPGRAWELLAGAALALRRSALEAPRGGRLVALGLFLIVGAAIMPPGQGPQLDNVLHRGAPVAGTTLIVAAGGGSLLSRIALEGRLMVFLGRVSYSLYLIHWPLLAFARNLVSDNGGLSTGGALGIVGVSLVLSALSFRFIETPFRRSRTWSRRALVGYGLTAFALAVPSLAIFSARGVPSRFDSETLALLAPSLSRNPLRTLCLRGDRQRDFKPFDPRCRVGPPGAPTLFVWGDSHADAVGPGFQDVAGALGRAYQQQTFARCSPLSVSDPECRKFNDRVLEYLAKESIDIVVLAARWATEYCGAHQRNQDFFDSSSLSTECDDTRVEATRSRMNTLVSALTGAQKLVVLVGDAPELQFRAPQCLARQRTNGDFLALLGRSSECTTPRSVVRARLDPLERTMQELELQNPLVVTVFLSASLCDDSVCHSARNQAPLYIDHGHLSAQAAIDMVRELGVSSRIARGLSSTPE
ncbi:MAG: acyltransferase [Deltaproteobacteria bacterium]|nr:acyltransferase [Deltaproteobacteria bacterium]